MEKTSSKPHPATLIRDLGLTDGIGTETFRGETRLIEALGNLYTMSQCTTGSAIRALHWSLETGVDELEKILGVPGRYPHLKELVVSVHGTNNNFDVGLVSIDASR
jgi:hypothetical protein